MYKRSAIVVLVNLAYFEVGLMVSIMGAIIPEIIRFYGLNYAAAASLPVAYYLSFGFMAIPSGLIIEKFSYKKSLLFAYLTVLAGILLFIYSGNFPSRIISIFVIGCALTLVQVLAFPLLREVMGAEKLPFNTTLNTLMYGVGAFASPYFYTLIAQWIKNPSTAFPFNILHAISAGSYPWLAVYYIFLVIFIITTAIIILVKFPPVHLSASEKIGNFHTFKELLSKKYLYLFFFALFSYAACEQGISNWIPQFLSSYHAVDPQTTGSLVLSLYWLLLSLGCVFGMVLLRYFSSLKILLLFTIAAVTSFCCAIFGTRTMAIWFFPITGLFHSVMWPLILSLAMNTINKHHGSLSGLLFAASSGGAFGAMMVGKLGDVFGLRWGLFFLIICYSVVASINVWSKQKKENNAMVIA
ncbi:sugar MFS transporter [Ilyomonas limi]|uniref:Sugar MFS transporter n=1 Tax=Ilyomonas limi TaxID=2575867 RepID=A0A4U3L571_9BACT|nr:MFS transporter [Ilyomonas limi]TKK70140.1 sugar MFS transporter [Ilyomonas limi]